MLNCNYIAAAVLTASIAALAPVTVNAGPQASASARLAQAAGPVVIHVQAQPSAAAPTAAAQPSEQPRRRRFSGPILGSMERAANPDDAAAAQSACAGAKVRTWDAASRRYVYTDDTACK
jgi:hypothetical protein